MFYPSDQTWYSNPNAASIHLGLDGFENGLEEDVLSGIHFFPNPTKEYIDITSDKRLYGECNAKIYNMLGEIVLYQDYNSFGDKQQMNVENLVPGAYIIEFTNNDKTNQHKLIIE